MSDNKEKRNSGPYPIRMPPHVHRDIKNQSIYEKRSFSNMALILLQEALAARMNVKKAPTDNDYK